MTRGGSMMSGGAPVSAGGAYSDRMMGPPTVHSSGQYVSGTRFLLLAKFFIPSEFCDRFN